MRFFRFLCLLFLPVAWGGTAFADPMTLPPITYVQTAYDQPVTLIFHPTVDLKTESDHLDASIAITADLTNLQASLPSNFE